MEEGSLRPVKSEGDDSAGDWRSQLSPDARQKIISKTLEILKNHVPALASKDSNDVRNIAMQFEEKTYTVAASQNDYLRRISMKLLSMQSKTQPSVPINPAISSASVMNRNPIDPGSLGIQSQTNMSGISQGSVNNLIGQAAQRDIYANAQRQVQGRQHQQHTISLQEYQHAQQQILKQKFQQSSHLQPKMEQQQSLLTPKMEQLQSTQPMLMQISSNLQSSQSNIQQTQAANTQSASQTGVQSLHEQSTLISQQSALSQQLMGKQRNISTMQRTQLLRQQNNATDIQQQRQRLLVQQNNLLSMRQQQIMNQRALSLRQQQQQQLGSQSYMSGLQLKQQLFGSLPSASNLQPHQRAMLMQKNTAEQQQQQQSALPRLQPQGQQSQHQSSQQQLMSQFRSQPSQLQQQLLMQQQSNSLQREMDQRLHDSSSPLQVQDPMEQKPFIQTQRGLQEVSSSTSIDLTAQSRHAGVPDWQEECYQKLKSMKEMYFIELYELNHTLRRQQSEAVMPPGQLEKLKNTISTVAQMLKLLQISKNNIQVGMNEKLPTYEKQIVYLIALHRPKKTFPQAHGQQQLQHPIVGSNVQHASMPLSTEHQNIPNTLQHGSSIDSVQGSPFCSMQQQGGSGSLQSSLNSAQQNNMTVLSQNSVQPNVGQKMKLEQHQQFLLTQQTKQHLQPYHIQQQIDMIQQQQREQLVQQQQMQQQTSQQLLSMNELNELKARQGSNIKSERYKYSAGQHRKYYIQQLKPGAPYPVSSPQSPQGDSEKPTSYMSSPGHIAHQQQLVAVSTPGISASPLLVECTNQDGSQAVPATSTTSATERPVDRLIKLVQTLTPEALSSSVGDIGSVISMIDWVAGSAPGDGFSAAVGEDLAAMTNSGLQAANFMSQDGGAMRKKMKRHTSAMRVNSVSSAGSANDGFMQIHGFESSELESSATSAIKRLKPEVNNALLEEIREINRMLIDTVVSVSGEDGDSVVTASEGGEGTVVKCSYTAVALSSDLKALLATAQLSPIMPLRLLVPATYPKSSPVLLDNLPVEPSEFHGKLQDLKTKAMSKFSTSLQCLSEPRSLKEMAKSWDACTRKAVLEYAQQAGGGCFSSTCASWENCIL